MTVNAFVDTNIVDRLLDLGDKEPGNERYEEDREFLSRIVKDYVEKDLVRLLVNPSVKQEIEDTPDLERRKDLIGQFNEFEFVPYNATVFSFKFPAKFLGEAESDLLEDILNEYPGFRKDGKILLDALSNPEIDVLLTADRDFKREEVEEISWRKLEGELKIFTPKELFEYLDEEL